MTTRRPLSTRPTVEFLEGRTVPAVTGTGTTTPDPTGTTATTTTVTPTDLSVSDLTLTKADGKVGAKFTVGISGDPLPTGTTPAPGAVAKLFWVNTSGRKEATGVNVPVDLSAGGAIQDVTGLAAPAWATGLRVEVSPTGWTEAATADNNLIVRPLEAPGTGQPDPPVSGVVSATVSTDGTRVTAYGADGGVLFSAVPYPVWGGRVSYAVGDVTGDGKSDLITAATAGGAPHVKVFDGTTGEELAGFYAYAQQFRGGVNLAVADIDGDGKAEIVTGAGKGGAPHVKVFNQWGDERQGFYAFDPSLTGGVSVAAADLTKDSKAEVVVGCGDSTLVRVLKGPTLNEMSAFMAYSGSYHTGVAVGIARAADGRMLIVTGVDTTLGLPIHKFRPDGTVVL